MPRTTGTARTADTARTARTADASDTSVEKIKRGLALLEEGLCLFEPGLLTGEGAAKLVGILNKTERAVVAAKALCARRVEKTNVHRRHGHKSAASWLASETEESVSEAASLLNTARQIEDLPEVAEAFKGGKLSSAKARQVAGAATSDPSKEHDLLEAAERQTLSELKSTCDDVKRQAASQEDEEEKYEAMRRRRYFRDRTDEDGCISFDGRLCPEDGAMLRAEILRRARRIATEARAQGRKESFSKYMADALVELLNGDGDKAGHSGAHVRVTVASEALLRGYAKDGETCEIEGVGKVPVKTAQKLLGEGFLSILVTRGKDVTTIASAGRAVPAAVDRALRARDKKCCVPGCDVTERLERDHRVIPFMDGGPTSLENLALLCRWHHYLRTYKGFCLEGTPDEWIWLGPDDRVVKDLDEELRWAEVFYEDSPGSASAASGGGGPPS